MAQVTVTAQYVADTTAYVNSLKRATQATNDLAAAMPGVSKATDRVKASTIGLGSAMGILGSMVMSKGLSAIQRFTSQGIAAAAEYEQTVISMQGIFQGTGMSVQQAADKTKSYLGELRDFAAKTPFELPQTLDAVKRLLSIGYAADDVKDRLLPAIGDITSALGQPASSISGVVYAFGQMKSAGRVLSQDLMQIGNALPGFNAKMTIAKELFNGDVAAMSKAMEDGSLDSNRAIDALIAGMQKFPGAAGAMERQSATLNGVISTFKDTVNNALIDGLMPAMPAISGALNQLVGPVSDLATAFAQALGPAIIRIVESAQTFIPILTDFAVRMLNLFPTIMTLVGALLQMAPAIAALAGPIVVVALAWKAWEFVSGTFDKIKVGLEALRAKQLALNTAVLANPYVLVAAAIVAALAAMAMAFKWVYDRSEELRRATAVLIQTIKNIVSVIANDLLGAFRSITGQTDKTANSSKSLADILKIVADVAGKVLAKYLEILGNWWKVLGNVIRVVIKGVEIAIKIFQMIAGIVRVALVAAFKKAGEILGWVLDKLGPLGKAFRKVGEFISSTFSKIPSIIRGAMSGAVGFIEGAINKAIDAINWLIEKYNAIPLLSDIALVSKIDFSGFGDAAAQVDKAALIAAESVRDANIANRLREQMTTPTTSDTTTTTTTGTDDKKGKKESDRLKSLQDKFNALKDTLNKAVDAYKVIAAATESKFGDSSQIIKAFGSEGDVSSAISMYDQLDAALRDYEQSIESAAGKNKKLAATELASARTQRASFKTLTQRAVDLYNERKRIMTAMEDAERDYAATQERINANYDRLEAAAQANIDAIEKSYATLIPQLEKALEAASAAYEKENKVLEDLISQRDQFLDQIGQGFRSFVNQFAVDETGGSFSASLEARLKSIRDFAANIRTLLARGLDSTLVQEFVSAGVSGSGDLVAQLAGASAEEIASINTQQAGLAAEISSFQQLANEQWYQAGISQQQAIVAPLQTAAEQAQMALTMAQQSRDTELAAARAHLESLKAARQAELAQAKTDYDTAVATLKSQLDQNKTNIDANAAEIQGIMSAMGDPANKNSLPNILLRVGKAAGDGLVKGLGSRQGALVTKAREMAEAMNRAFRDTLQIASPSRVTRTIGEQVAAGLILGMEQSMGLVTDAAGALGRAAIPSVGATAGITAAGGVAGGVVVQPGAVQMTFSGSMDSQSADQIREIVDQALLGLAREIRRTS